MVARTPAVLLEAPFEVFITFVAAMFGIAQLVGLSNMSVVSRALPDLLEDVYGGTLLLACASLVVGLRKGGINPPTTAGLRLMGCGMTVYAVVAIGAAGFAAVFVGPAFLGIAGLCGIRSFVITTGKQAQRAVAVEAARQ